MEHSKSISDTVYNVLALVCFYIIALCIFMDTFVHRHVLAYAVKKFRILVGFILVTWMHFTFR
jgi:hypothetical protein